MKKKVFDKFGKLVLGTALSFSMAFSGVALLKSASSSSVVSTPFLSAGIAPKTYEEGSEGVSGNWLTTTQSSATALTQLSTNIVSTDVEDNHLYAMMGHTYDAGTYTLNRRDGSAEKPFEISKPEHLVTLAAFAVRSSFTYRFGPEVTDTDSITGVDFSKMYFKLVEKIDLSAHEWRHPINNFTGVFDGNGFSITGLTILDSTSVSGGLFNNVMGYNVEGTTYKNVEIKNLTMDDVFIYGEGSSYVRAKAAIVGGTATRITMDNCSVDGVIYDLTSTNNSRGTGGLVSRIGRSSFTAISPDVNEIKNSTNHAHIVSLTESTGGILGYFTGGSTNDGLAYLLLTNNKNYGDINNVEYLPEGYTLVYNRTNRVGGIYGGYNQDSNIIFDSCENLGDITGYSYIGGIAGYMTMGPVIFKGETRNEGNITSYYRNGVNSYVGGIAGHLVNAKIYGTADKYIENSGNVTTIYDGLGSSDRDGYYVGGIVGYVSNSNTRNNNNIDELTFDAEGKAEGFGRYIEDENEELFRGVIAYARSYAQISGGVETGGVAGQLIRSDLINVANNNGKTGDDFIGTTINARYGRVAGLVARLDNVNGGHIHEVYFDEGNETYANAVIDLTNYNTSHAHSNGTDVAGMFGRVENAFNFENLYNNTELVLDYEYSSYSVNMGGVIATLIANGEVNITNATNNENITGKNNTGGIIGRIVTNDADVTLRNVNNYGNISAVSYSGTNGSANNIGGILGYSADNRTSFKKVIIDNAHNTGNITHKRIDGGSANSIAGLVGTGYRLEVSNSSSTGVVDTRSDGINTSSSYVAGLFGYVHELVVTNSNFDGEVFGDNYVAGVIGRTHSIFAENVTVRGNIKATTNYVGGFGGIMENPRIDNCSFDGEVSGNQYVGGFASQALLSTTIHSNNYNKPTYNRDEIYDAIYIHNSYSSGKVTAAAGYVAGFVTYTSSVEIKYSYNEADVQGSADYIGGFVGATNYVRINHTQSGFVVQDKFSSFENCYNTGFVSVEENSATKRYIGGFIGSAIRVAYIKNSFNLGEVYGSGDRVGGFIGNLSGAGSTTELYGFANDTLIENSYNEGNVDLHFIGTRIGGFIGSVESINLTVKGSYTKGTIGKIGSGANSQIGNYSGGFIGYMSSSGRVSDNTKLIEDSYAIGKIGFALSTEWAGLFVGRIEYVGVTGASVNVTTTFKDTFADMIVGEYRQIVNEAEAVAGFVGEIYFNSNYEIVCDTLFENAYYYFDKDGGSYTIVPVRRIYGNGAGSLIPDGDNEQVTYRNAISKVQVSKIADLNNLGGKTFTLSEAFVMNETEGVNRGRPYLKNLETVTLNVYAAGVDEPIYVIKDVFRDGQNVDFATQLEELQSKEFRYEVNTITGPNNVIVTSGNTVFVTDIFARDEGGMVSPTLINNVVEGTLSLFVLIDESVKLDYRLYVTSGSAGATFKIGEEEVTSVSYKDVKFGDTRIVTAPETITQGETTVVNFSGWYLVMGTGEEETRTFIADQVDIDLAVLLTEEFLRTKHETGTDGGVGFMKLTLVAEYTNDYNYITINANLLGGGYTVSVVSKDTEGIDTKIVSGGDNSEETKIRVNRTPSGADDRILITLKPAIYYDADKIVSMPDPNGGDEVFLYEVESDFANNIFTIKVNAAGATINLGFTPIKYNIDFVAKKDSDTLDTTEFIEKVSLASQQAQINGSIFSTTNYARALNKGNFKFVSWTLLNADGEESEYTFSSARLGTVGVTKQLLDDCLTEDGKLLFVANYQELFAVRVQVTEGKSEGEIKISYTAATTQTYEYFNEMSGNFERGQQIVISATANEYHTFVSYKIEVGNTVQYINSPIYVLTVNENVTISAEFERTKYEIVASVLDTAGEEITDYPMALNLSSTYEGSIYYVSINDILYSALVGSDNVIEGYEFLGWYLVNKDGEYEERFNLNDLYVDSAFLTDYLVDGKVGIVARYSKILYLTVYVPSNFEGEAPRYSVYQLDENTGEYLAVDEEEVDFRYGDRLQLRLAQLPKFLNFINITGSLDDVDLEMDGDVLEFVIANDTQFNLNFEAVDVAVAPVLNTENATGEVSNNIIDETVKLNDMIVLSFKPQAGYEVRSWTINNKSVEEFVAEMKETYEINYSATTNTITIRVTEKWINWYEENGIDSKIETQMNSTYLALLLGGGITIPVLLIIMGILMLSAKKKKDQIKKAQALQKSQSARLNTTFVADLIDKEKKDKKD